jgi:hypothetical protein
MYQDLITSPDILFGVPFACAALIFLYGLIRVFRVKHSPKIPKPSPLPQTVIPSITAKPHQDVIILRNVICNVRWPINN